MKNGYLLLRLAVVGIGLFIAGIFMTAENIADRSSISKGVLDINSVSLSDIQKGRFVEGDIQLICDEFAYLEEYDSTLGVKHNERVTNHYYVIPLMGSEDDQYVAIEVGNADMVKVAENMTDEFWKAVDSDDWSGVTTTLHFQGKIEKMNSDLTDYMYEWFSYMYDDFTKEDMNTVTCPYVIKYYAPGYEERGSTAGIIILLLGLVISAITAVFFVKAKKEQKIRDEALAESFAGYGNGISERDTVNGYTPVESVTSGNIAGSLPEAEKETPSVNESSDYPMPWEK